MSYGMENHFYIDFLPQYGNSDGTGDDLAMKMSGVKSKSAMASSTMSSEVCDIMEFKYCLF